MRRIVVHWATEAGPILVKYLWFNWDTSQLGGNQLNGLMERRTGSLYPKGPWTQIIGF